MKSEFLKIAGVKTEKAFYKKYPTEEAFFKAHPEANKHIKKAQTGLDVNKNGIPDYLEGIQPIQGPQNQWNFSAQTFPSIQQPAGTQFNNIPSALPKAPALNMPALPTPTTGMGVGAFDRNVLPPSPGSPVTSSFATKAAPYIGAAADVIGGIGNLKAQKQEKLAIRQMRKVTDLQKIASGTREEEPERRYNTPYDNMIQPDQMFPTYGVGTNVLARDGARLYSGGEIQNTYAPDYLYDDLEYEPLNDSNIKQYYDGGGIPRAQDGGGFMDFMGSQGGGQALGMLGGALNNNSAESQIGKGIGTAAGTAFGGPVGGMIGGALGGAVGGLFNTSQKSIKRDKRAIKKNMDTIMGNQFGQAFQNQYSSVVRDGGNIPNYKDGGQTNYDVKNSIVDLLKSKNRDSDYSSRKELANKLGIKNYRGTADQNVEMIDIIERGNNAPKTNERITPIKKSAIKKQKPITEKPKETPKPVAAKPATPVVAKPKQEVKPITRQIEPKPKPVQKTERSTIPSQQRKREPIPVQKTKPVAVKQKVITTPKADISKEARKLQSGVITDKGSNITYVIENGKIVKSFPVLTGESSESNYNPYSVEELETNKKGRATPTGTYLMNPNSNIYGEPGFNLQGIPAFGQPAPIAANTAIHTLYGTNPNKGQDGYDPKEGRRRTVALNSSNPKDRYMSYGCTNARCDNMRELAQRFPAKDTAIYIDSRLKKDANYLKSIKRKEFGGEIPNYEEGGYMNPEYNPQVITQFGGLDEQDFYDYAHDGMESLRAGGHIRGEYTPISNRGMEQYAMGGEVKTTWGGHAETISHNPYMPGTGETIMFRGKSHDESDGNGNTGIGVKYGQGGHDSYTDYAEYGTQEADADVEVERGEPAAELQDANGEKNLTVYGNLKIPNQYLDLLGDKNAKGKKFKNYVADLSKIEAKQNKIVENSTNKLNALDVQNSFDKLKLTSLQASIQGANMKLKDLADKKMNAAYLQNAINDTAEENGLVADDLARGKVKFDKEALQEYARYGTSIPKAKDGNKIKPGSMTVKEAIKQGYVLEADGKYHLRTKANAKPASETKKASALDAIPKGQRVDKKTGLYGGVTPEEFKAFKDQNKWYTKWDTFDPNDPNDVDDFAKAFNAESEKRGSKARILADDKTGKTTKVGKQVVSAKLDDAKQEGPAADTDKVADIYEPEDNIYPVEPQKRSFLLDAASQILPYFRPTDQESLDPNQLMGEMYALSNNQLEPVQAQSYQPNLLNTYDISLQDQLNANQADFNATQRMVGYNPAALAQLNAQKYAANTRVLGEQFRQNQAMDMGIYNANTQTLNDAKLKNLEIFDRQYGRQSQAKSNTKAVTQAALNSISDKFAKNKLENRELGIYENMYNYRFDPSGRAINMNAPWQPNVPNVYDSGEETPNMRAVYDQQGRFLRWERIDQGQTTTTPETTTAETTTPETTTAIPFASTNPTVSQNRYGGKVRAKNGSIVSAYKNL